MVRTQIQLTEEQAKQLQRIAKRAGVSRAAIIRRFVDSISETDASDDAALSTRVRLRTFMEDWDLPDMEAYDDL
jgi:hypothetical protein